MSMTRKTITIPDSMEGWIKSQIDNGRYCSDSEYLRDLIRKDQDQRLAQQELSSLINEGIDSGISPRSVSDIMKSTEDRLIKDSKLPTN